MSQILIFVKENILLPNPCSYKEPHNKVCPIISLPTHLISRFHRKYSEFIQNYILLLLSIPHTLPFATWMHNCCKRPVSQLYTEAAPCLQTPPLKLMSAAKFSTLANMHQFHHCNKSCWCVPVMILTCLLSNAFAVPHHFPHQCGVFSLKR